LSEITNELKHGAFNMIRKSND